VSKIIGTQLPEDLYERLSGNNLEAYTKTAILVSTVDTGGWPHPAILSYFEVIAKDQVNVVLAIYRDSTTAANIRRDGKLTMCIIDERIAYYIKGTAQEIVPRMSSMPFNAKLNLRVEQVLSDEANEEFEKGAYITTGIRYERPRHPDAAKLLQELMD
jgi:hypothetical protein